MEKKYIERKDSRTGKIYLTLKKSKKRREYERKLIYIWCNKNLARSKEFEHVSALTLYNKFIKDSGLVITLKSFGNYLKYGLPKLGLNNNKFIKVGEDHIKRSYYFGLKIQNERSEISLFNVVQKVGFNKYKHVDFGFINEEKIKAWVLDCLTINKELLTKIAVVDLLKSFSKYYDLVLPPTRKNVTLFGKELSSFYAKDYSFIERKSIFNPAYITKTNKQGILIGHTCIKFK